MRYYNFKLNTNAKQIKENSTIDLRDYDYENPISAVNKYFYRKKNNNISFFMYREERVFDSLKYRNVHKGA